MYDGTPPQGLSGARRARNFLILVTDPPRGRPIGGGGVHRKKRNTDGIPSSYLNFLIFMGYPGNHESRYS